MTTKEDGRYLQRQSWTIVNDREQLQIMTLDNDASAFPSFSDEDIAIRFARFLDPSDGPVPYEITSFPELLELLKTSKSESGVTHVAFDPVHQRISTTEMPTIDSVIASLEAAIGGY
jgi:hypothetical protein